MSAFAAHHGFSALIVFRQFGLGLHIGDRHAPPGRAARIVDAPFERSARPAKAPSSRALTDAAPSAPVARTVNALSVAPPEPKPQVYAPSNVARGAVELVYEPSARGRLFDVIV